MVDISKIGLALFLVGFWLFLPIPLQLMGVTGYNVIDTSIEIDDPADTGLGFFAWLKPITQAVGTYFNILVFNIPDVNNYIRYFVNFLQLGTVLFIALFLRGGGD